MTPEDWEGAAAELLDATCTTAPVDMFRLAAACGIQVRAGKRSRICLEDGVAHVDLAARAVRQQGLLAHELGHFALERSGLPQCEQGARYIAGALRLPRREFDRDLRRVGWSIVALQALHPHASAQAILVRIVQLRNASACVVDPTDKTAPWRISPERTPVTERELELARRAWAAKHELVEDGAVALPMQDALGEHRVLVAVAKGTPAAGLRR